MNGLGRLRFNRLIFLTQPIITIQPNKNSPGRIRGRSGPVSGQPASFNNSRLAHQKRGLKSELTRVKIGPAVPDCFPLGFSFFFFYKLEINRNARQWPFQADITLTSSSLIAIGIDELPSNLGGYLTSCLLHLPCLYPAP